MGARALEIEDETVGTAERHRRELGLALDKAPAAPFLRGPPRFLRRFLLGDRDALDERHLPIGPDARGRRLGGNVRQELARLLFHGAPGMVREKALHPRPGLVRILALFVA